MCLQQHQDLPLQEHEGRIAATQLTAETLLHKPDSGETSVITD